MGNRPLRILQVASFMAPEHGGAEIWLMQLLRSINRDNFHLDFLVHTPKPQAFHDEIRALGSKVIPCVRPIHLWKYPFAFRRILREHGPYDIVHTHILYGAFVLRLARWFGVPTRIFHAHADQGSLRGNGFLVDRFFRITDRWIFKDATCGIAVSRKAADSRFGTDWNKDPRWKIVYCGVDLPPFKAAVDRGQVRAELGLPPDAFVMGHVGRFAREKNHRFLLQVARQVIRHEPRARLLLVGDGELRPAIEQEIANLGLSDKIILTGLRKDVPRLLLGAMDVFVFPSITEGLGLSLVEAQAAGLQSLTSEAVTAEVDLVPGLVQHLPLAKPEVWARAILSMDRQRMGVNRQDALKMVERSSFTMENCVKKLEQIYAESGTKQDRP